MRPVRLEVEGFTVFRSPTVVDFEGADLFALVGPTGAGKTSIIDALTFALYGSVPRLDDRRAVAPVISQNLTEARVRLDFTVDGRPHTAVRVVRATKSGGATTKEARLERAGEVLAGNADEVTEAVTALLGLTFEHFTTCVSLPQGQFARFLHDKPRSRQDLLVKLLDLGLYERVATAARARAAVARSGVDVATGQLERLAGATPEARAAAAGRVTALAALDERLAAARPVIDELNAAVVAAEAAAAEATERLARLDRLAAPAGIAELAAEVAAAERARRRCADVDAGAVATVAEAEAALAALPERAALDQARRDHARRAELADTLERGEVAEADADAALAAAADALDAAVTAHAAAQAERERVLVALRAQALVPELVAGAPCPVCGQEVAELPAHAPVADREIAERAVADADKAVTRARKVHGEAQTQQARVDEKLVRVRAELAEIDERLGGAGDVDALESALAEIDAAMTALDKARQGERDARTALADATRVHEALVGREAEGRRAFDAARDAVAALGPPAAERRDLAADWQALVGWAAEQVPALAEAVAGHRHRVEEGRREVAERLRAVLAECAEVGVEVAPARWPGEAVAAAHARAEAEVARIDEQLAEAERLRSRAGGRHRAAPGRRHAGRAPGRQPVREVAARRGAPAARRHRVDAAARVERRRLRPHGRRAIGRLRRGRPHARVPGPLGPHAVGRRDVPGLPGARPRSGRPGGRAGVVGVGPARVAVPRRGVRDARPRHARRRGHRPRRAGRPRPHGRHRDPRPRAGRAASGAVRGAQGGRLGRRRAGGRVVSRR